MDPKFFERVISAVEPHVLSRSSSVEFEMAYQSRIAIDRIRFALQNTEQLSIRPEQIREVNLQLLDALDRLESADRHFQARFRAKPCLSEAEQPLCNNGNGASRGKHDDGR